MVLYTWPAGHPGLLRGYTYDRESGEFTVYHLKQTIEALATAPEVDNLHIIAHSRGCDVATSALRELFIEIRGSGREPRDVLKIENLVLAAPDLDMEVVQQRLGAERFSVALNRLTIYLNAHDKAIGLAEWLFDSVTRFGQLRASQLTESQRAVLQNMPAMSFIDVRAKTKGLGHSYFVDNPAVLSDLILLLREGRSPGAANGRPLAFEEDEFWAIDDGYPVLDGGDGS